MPRAPYHPKPGRKPKEPKAEAKGTPLWLKLFLLSNGILLLLAISALVSVFLRYGWAGVQEVFRILLERAAEGCIVGYIIGVF